MPTNIRQIDDAQSGVTVLRIDGDLFREDADIITRIANNVRNETGNSIVIDLADLDFLDSESAPILKKLESEIGFDIVGTEIFVQTMVDKVEGR